MKFVFMLSRNGFLGLFVLMICSVFLDLKHICISLNLRTSIQEMSAEIVEVEPKC